LVSQGLGIVEIGAPTNQQ